jgi:hypothetical protein
MNVTEVIKSKIDGAFYGWSGNTAFKLANGQLWEQDAYAYKYYYAYCPNVKITDVNGTYVMEVDGVSENIPVRRVHDFIESNIDGEFKGWDGKTVFNLVNGQIWQQSTYAYYYHYAYRPKVLIYLSKGGLRLKVEGVNEIIDVKKIK